MREFKSLSPAGLPDGFDAQIHGEEPIVKVAESKGRISLSFTFPGFYISDDSCDIDGERLLFKQCNIAKTGFLSESGKPLLPSFGRYVQIPFNSEYTVSVKKSKPVQFDDVLLFPAQQVLTDSPDETHTFEYDKAFYDKDEIYPFEMIEVSGPFDIDGYNALLLHVRPFQYNPAKRMLIGYGNIAVDITIKHNKAKSDTRPFLDPSLNKEGFGNLLLNPGRRIEERLEILPVETVTPFMPRGPEFLIIYHETSKVAADKLALWKNKRGLVTETVSISTVGNNVENIKKYIRKIRKSIFSKLRYVLLFGDVDMITSEPIDGVVTDYYYSTEKDAVGSDYVLPWLSIGRIPVRTADQGNSVVDDVIKYEKNPPADAEYYRRMTFGAYFQDDFPQDGKDDRCYMKTMEDIRDHMITLGFSVDRVYVSNNPNPVDFCDGTTVSADVKAAIVDENTATNMLVAATTSGNLIIGHRDHGNWDGWSHPPFTVTNLNSVSGGMQSMFYSINCLTGQFDLTAPTECFAEKILRMVGGAPSLVAATRVSGTWRNHSLIKALFDAVWAGVIATFPGATASYPVRYRRLGDILNYAKSYLPVKHSGDNAGIKNHFEIYHVIGDPTLELWNAEPLSIGLRATIRQRYLYILLSSCPKDCVITIWFKNKMVKRIEPSSTSIQFKVDQVGSPHVFPAVDPVAVTICFWAPGCRYREIIVHP